MSSAVRGGAGIAPGKHPTAIRLWREKGEIVCSRCGNELAWTESSPQEMYGADLPRIMENDDVWLVCGPCLAAMPDVPLGIFGTVTDQHGDETDLPIGGDI
jgi:hypothetical protein